MMMTRRCCVVTQPWNSSAWLTFCHLSLMTESGWWTAGRSMWLLQVYSWCLLTHCRPWGDTSGQPLTPGPWTQIIPTSGLPCWFTINLGHWCWGLENRLTRAYTRVEKFFLPLFNFSGCRIDYFLDFFFFKLFNNEERQTIRCRHPLTLRSFPLVTLDYTVSQVGSDNDFCIVCFFLLQNQNS